MRPKLKPSYYNHIIPYKDNEYVLFNARTLATCTISPEMVQEVNELLTASIVDNASPLIEIFQNAGYLISIDENEKQQIQEKFRQAKSSKINLGLTIAPTMGCNFNCPYCFESESIRSNFYKMPQEIQSQLITRVKQFILKNNCQSVGVTWFGGEPLLAIDVIENLSKKFMLLKEELNIAYDADLVTNGYKLSPDNIQVLLACGVTKAQITIDGPEHIHDTRRIVKNGKGSYQKIINNVTEAVDKGMNLNIRINIDQSNFNEIELLLNDFQQRNLKDKVSFSLGHIANEYIASSTTVENLRGATFADLDIKLLNMLSEHIDSSAWLPSVVTHYCSADSESAFMIGPRGELYQCWDEFGDVTKIVGNISLEDKTNPLHVAEYMEFDPTQHPKCTNCNVMPLCMGGCSKQRLLHQGEPQCGVYKYNLKDWIVNFTDSKQKEQLD